MANKVFALVPRPRMIGARAIHHFSDLGLMRGVFRIDKEHATQPDVIGAITVEKLEPNRTRENIGKLFVDRKGEAGRLREVWRYACDRPSLDVALQILCIA
jgi:hypothetical protein